MNSLRLNRIRALRIRLHVHQELARQHIEREGPLHFDTLHQWGVIEEISAKLSRELRMLEMELEAPDHRGWDTEVMRRTYDL